jgi:hypothetical protein
MKRSRRPRIDHGILAVPPSVRLLRYESNLEQAFDSFRVRAV